MGLVCKVLSLGSMAPQRTTDITSNGLQAPTSPIRIFGAKQGIEVFEEWVATDLNRTLPHNNSQRYFTAVLGEAKLF